ncbi:hypothetical protein Tco_0407914 [Tanacetum coccineum]
MISQKGTKPQLPPRKSVEQNCVHLYGGHFIQNCPATNSNIYHDNIQEYVSQAAAANFNQANSGYRPPMVSNQIRPPGFPPIQNLHRQNIKTNFNEENKLQSKQRKNNFNQGIRLSTSESINQLLIKDLLSDTRVCQKTVLKDMSQPMMHVEKHAKPSLYFGSGNHPGNTVTNPKGRFNQYHTEVVSPSRTKKQLVWTCGDKGQMPPANNGMHERRPTPIVQNQSGNPNPEPNVFC